MITDKYADDFILALDEKRFYDAHEVLEKLWFPNRFVKTNEVLLLKGFINASVSFELIKKGKEKASQIPWKTYLKYKTLLFETTSTKEDIYNKISLHIEKTRKNISI